MRKRQEFSALNWLRFLLAVYLVLFHTLYGQYPAVVESNLSSLLGLGNFATSVFFVLSGFLLTNVYITQRTKPIERRDFFVARFASLYPAHIIAVGIYVPVILVSVYFRGGYPVALANGEVQVLGRIEILVNLASTIALTHAWNPLYIMVNGPSWSISALLCFYLSFPFLAPRLYALIHPRRALIYLGCAFALPALIAYVLELNDPITAGVMHRNPVVRFPLFAAGILLASIYSRAQECSTCINPPRFRWIALILATLALGVYLAPASTVEHAFIVTNALYFPAAVATVWVCATARPGTNSWLSHWGARWGKASISIFLLHLPIVTVLSKIEQILVSWWESVGTMDFTMTFSMARSVERDITFYPLYLLVILFASLVFQEKVVLPLQRRIRQWFSKSPKQHVGFEVSGSPPTEIAR